MPIRRLIPAVALVAVLAPAVSAQIIFEAPKSNEYVVERVNPRAAQLVRAMSPALVGQYIPAEQFDKLDRPYKNAGVWATSPHTIMRKVRPEEEHANYYEMKQLLMKKEEAAAEVKGVKPPTPRAIIRIPMEPERKPANPNADQGRITIRPLKATEKTGVAVASH
jgi:hypothetical protein